MTGEEMTAIRETLVACLNEWRARLKADDRRAVLEFRVASFPDAERHALTEALTEDEKAMLQTKALSSEDRSKLFMRCIDGVRLLLLSYGPAPPDADKEFVKLLLFMRGMQEKPTANIPVTTNIAARAAREAADLPRDGKAGDLAVKKQTTMNDYFTRE